MATRADVRRIAAANRQISDLAQRDLRRLWATLDTGNAMAVREAMEDLLPDLIVAYGELSATVAADWYDEMREQAGARGAYTATLAPPVAAEAVRANARWAIGPLFSSSPEPDAALGRLEREADRMVLQPGRDTRTLSAKQDPAGPRFARVPTSPKPCAFCSVMASRGPVYWSEKAAGGTSDYHSDCNCEVVQVYDGQGLPEGYEPDALYQSYSDARQEAGSGDLKTVLSKMREQQGIH